MNKSSPPNFGESRWGDAPEHKILPNAISYHIVALHIEPDPADGSEAFMDLTVRRGTERRLPRFWSPQELEIERGGPTNTGGFQIQDISSRRMEDLGVRAYDCEAGGEGVSFVARRVDDLTKELE
jgi:hypothetical protein